MYRLLNLFQTTTFGIGAATGFLWFLKHLIKVAEQQTILQNKIIGIGVVLFIISFILMIICSIQYGNSNEKRNTELFGKYKAEQATVNLLKHEIAKLIINKPRGIVLIDIENIEGFGEYCGDAGENHSILWFDANVLVKKSDEKRIRDLIKKFKEEK